MGVTRTLASGPLGHLYVTTMTNGQCIGFIGDRTDQDPFPIALLESVWGWEVPLVYKNQTTIDDFYDSNPTNYGSLFPPPGNTPSTKAIGKKKKDIGGLGDSVILQDIEVEFPYLLSLPMCIFSRLVHQTYWMPHELLRIVNEAVAHFDVQVESACWTTMREWCLAATQLRTPDSTDSVASLGAGPHSCQLGPPRMDYVKIRHDDGSAGPERLFFTHRPAPSGQSAPYKHAHLHTCPKRTTLYYQE